MPFRVTLGTGQPKLMSMWSTSSSPLRTRADSPMASASQPKIWMERGRSSAPNWASFHVRSCPQRIPRELTISLTHRPAP